MNLNSVNPKFSALLAKGGIMLFSIERPNVVYKGSIMLSPLKNCCQKRAVQINEYRYYEQNQEEQKGGIQ